MKSQKQFQSDFHFTSFSLWENLRNGFKEDIELLRQLTKFRRRDGKKKQKKKKHEEQLAMEDLLWHLTNHHMFN